MKASRKWCAIAALAFSTWAPSLEDASACLPGSVSRDEVPFSKLVAQASNITVARVVSATPLDLQHPPSYEDDTTRFTFRTIERVKGAAPTEFTLNGASIPDLTQFAEEARLAHDGLGSFWAHFVSGCGRFPRSFAVGTIVLFFTDARGDVIDFFGRGAQLLPSLDDQWLAAVRAMVRKPSLKKGRRGRLIDLLAGARAIFLSQTTACEFGGSKERRVLRQIWGKPASTEQLAEMDDWAIATRCDLSNKRMTIIFADGYHAALPMTVRGRHELVDFTGLVNGTDQGLVGNTFGMLGSDVWFSQIDFDEPLVWSLAQLETRLNSFAAAQGR